MAAHQERMSAQEGDKYVAQLTQEGGSTTHSDTIVKQSNWKPNKCILY